jgi:hypothetical protein
VIVCSRESQICEIDEEAFVDTYAQYEQDNIQSQCDDSATGWDGSWIWDHQPIKTACWLFGQPCRGSAGGSGRPRFFSTAAAAAEEAAVQVWTAMLQATKRPCTPVLQQLAQQPAASVDASGSGSEQACDSSEEEGQQPDSSLAAAAARLKTISRNGLPSWTAKVSWFDDPFDTRGEGSLKNEVCTTIKVEVVRADLV